MRHTKVAIVGAGAVGSTTAYTLILNSIAAEIMLIDINEERCKGEVLDLTDSLTFSETLKIHQSSIGDARDADIIIICAGVAQKPKQPRTELVSTNKKIVVSIMENLKPFKDDTIVIIVTNPVDAITFFAQQASGISKNKIFGTGTFLDTQRMMGALSQKLNTTKQSIQTYILGEHGDSQVPIWSNTYIDGKSILEFPNITQKKLDMLIKETRQKAYEIIKCKGATFFGIASCISSICESILFDQKKIIPISTFVEESGLYLGMPVIIGRNGIEKIVQISLNEEEKKMLKFSSEKIKKTIDMA